MSQENVEIAQRLLDPFNRRDIDGFADATTPDFEWSPSVVAVDGEVFAAVTESKPTSDA
jgi:ketosteroid isomerase-like protein